MDPVTLTLQPGQNGTKQLSTRYGANLVCVRYRKCPLNKSYKTIELRIPDDLLLAPDVVYGNATLPTEPNLVLLRVAWDEQALHETLKRHNGRWVPEEKCWQLEKRVAYQLNLEGRIVASRQRSNT